MLYETKSLHYKKLLEFAKTLVKSDSKRNAAIKQQTFKQERRFSKKPQPKSA